MSSRARNGLLIPERMPGYAAMRIEREQAAREAAKEQAAALAAEQERANQVRPAEISQAAYDIAKELMAELVRTKAVKRPHDPWVVDIDLTKWYIELSAVDPVVLRAKRQTREDRVLQRE